jgi:hypothetical protein
MPLVVPNSPLSISGQRQGVVDLPTLESLIKILEQI